MVVDIVLMLFSFRGKMVDDAINAGYVDYSGEGRDKHGK